MKILVSSWEAAIADVDDLFSDLKESQQQLHDLDPDMVSEGVTPESLIDVDNEFITTAPMIVDDDILRNVTTNQQEQSDENDDNDGEVEEEAPKRPLRFQVQSGIDVI